MRILLKKKDKKYKFMFRNSNPRFFGLRPQNDNQQQKCHSERSEESILIVITLRGGCDD